MSGSSCATTGSRTASSHPTRIFWITAAPPGISSPISHGPSCPSACATGHIGSDQRDPVLGLGPTSYPIEVGVDARPEVRFRHHDSRSDSLRKCSTTSEVDDLAKLLPPYTACGRMFHR